MNDMWGNSTSVPANYNNAFDPFSRGRLIQYKIPRVNGQAGAEQFRMAPNSDALLFDANEPTPVVWFVQTDGAGYLTATPYDLILRQPPRQISLNDVMERLTQLEEKINARQSNYGANKQSKKQHNDAATTATTTTIANN